MSADGLEENDRQTLIEDHRDTNDAWLAIPAYIARRKDEKAREAIERVRDSLDDTERALTGGDA